MRRSYPAVGVMMIAGVAMLLTSGCASARLNKGGSKPLPPAERIAQLEREAQTKDQTIGEMQRELEVLRARETESYDTLEHGSGYTESKKTGSAASKSLRVPGVSVEQVQNALKVAGFNPGAVDGRFGAKTKDAVKRFQRKFGLTADGVVGQKTWSLLKRQSDSAGLGH